MRLVMSVWIRLVRVSEFSHSVWSEGYSRFDSTPQRFLPRLSFPLPTESYSNFFCTEHPLAIVIQYCSKHLTSLPMLRPLACWYCCTQLLSNLTLLKRTKWKQLPVFFWLWSAAHSCWRWLLFVLCRNSLFQLLMMMKWILIIEWTKYCGKKVIPKSIFLRATRGFHTRICKETFVKISEYIFYPFIFLTGLYASEWCCYTVILLGKFIISFHLLYHFL